MCESAFWTNMNERRKKQKNSKCLLICLRFLVEYRARKNAVIVQTKNAMNSWVNASKAYIVLHSTTNIHKIVLCCFNF